MQLESKTLERRMEVQKRFAARLSQDSAAQPTLTVFVTYLT
jgi:hypothetical protein